MFDINLVPEIQKQKQQQSKRNTYATIIGSVVVGGVVLGLVIMGSLKVAASVGLTNTQKEIDAVKAESVQYKELEDSVLSLENGLLAIKNTLDGQNNWTVLLPHLEEATPKDVRFHKLTIEGTTVVAQLSGKSVNSIARFIESYKEYQVLVLSGSGTPQETVTVSLDGSILGTTRVKTDGSWVYAARVTTDKDFQMDITGATNDKVTYTRETSMVKAEYGSVGARVENLFSNMNTKQYQKEGSTVNFDSTFTVLTGVLW
jgi:Tfp pilus assembly protein PilN